MAKKKKKNSSVKKRTEASPVLPALFTLTAIFATCWAWFLIGVHYDAVAGCHAAALPAQAAHGGALQGRQGARRYVLSQARR